MKLKSKKYPHIDFTFDPAYTDELLVVYLDRDGKCILVSHES